MVSSPQDTTSLRIIIVGEDSLFRAGVAQLLNDLRCQTRIECVDSIPDMSGTQGRSFDQALLIAPGLKADLGDLVRAAKAKLPGTPVAVVALADSLPAVRSAMAAGAVGFVPAVSPPKLILHAVQLMLSGGVYVPSSLLGSGFGQTQAGDLDEPGRTRLTGRQQAVLQELAKGRSNKQIAGVLGLSEATVKVHVAAIMKTLKAENRTQAVLNATQAGILEDQSA